MNVQNINNTNFKGKELITREFSGALKDGSTALCKVHHDGFNIKALDCFVLNNKKQIVGGVGVRKNSGITPESLNSCITKLQKNANEGFCFMQELVTALIK